MPIGIVTKDQFKQETDNRIVDKSNQDAIPARSLAIIEDAKKLGRNNKPEVPEIMRNVIAQEALSGTPVSEVAKEYKVSPQAVHAYKNGATSLGSYNEGDTRLKKSNGIFRDTIIKKAGRVGIKALNAIDDQELESATLMEKASVAKTMSSIVKDMTPEKSIDRGNNAQFIFFAPGQKNSEDYEVINVTE